MTEESNSSTQADKVEDPKTNKKWYEINDLLIGWIIVFFPIAIYGYWQRKEYDKNTRWLYSIITVIAAMSLLGLGSTSRYAVFFLAAPGYAWYVWSSDIASKAQKIPLVVAAALLVLSGFAELGSLPIKPNKNCPRTVTTSSGYTYVVDCSGNTLGGLR
ncbi:hypothetical protein MNBD_GAMMA12-1214 [hydrothermal vent metagenome]|uniref:Uncharacterized protein n=1 Tax=hydrothermal vent metagenome TaxID=652676 RepID=A0A3B0YZ85_9ZZZZ